MDFATKPHKCQGLPKASIPCLNVPTYIYRLRVLGDTRECHIDVLSSLRVVCCISRHRDGQVEPNPHIDPLRLVVGLENDDHLTGKRGQGHGWWSITTKSIET